MGERQWTVEFHDEFEAEFEAMDEDVQDELLATAKALQALGPAAGRPYVGTLRRSSHANMKELRFDAKGGFYKRLIKKADERFDKHLAAISARKPKRN